MQPDIRSVLRSAAAAPSAPVDLAALRHRGRTLRTRRRMVVALTVAVVLGAAWAVPRASWVSDLLRDSTRVPPGGTAGVCPDGTSRFAYTAEAKPIRQTDVTLLADGESIRITRDHLSENPSFSPGGKEIVFSNGRDGRFYEETGYERLALFTVSSTGGHARRLTQGPYDAEPDWSPDGSTVVFVRGRSGKTQELWAVDVATKREWRLVRFPPGSAGPVRLSSPAWSPDGQRIAFVRTEGRTGRPSLWTMRADGSDARLILETQAQTGGLSWSPAGDEIVFHDLTDQGWSVFILGPEERLRLLDRGGRWPAWSPDGSAVAYFDETSGHTWRLTIRDGEGGPKRLVEGGPELFYVYGALDWAPCK